MTEEENVFVVEKDKDWINKSRTLLVTSRGITPSQRKLILDLFNLLPHTKKEYKLEKEDLSQQISELCQIHKCSHFIYFETKKRVKFCMWVGGYPYGPSFKFWIDNPVGSLDMKLQGNCLKNARHILSFDSHFQGNPVWKVARNLLTQTFNIPLYHPSSKSVIDHVLSFTVEPKSNTIWFKNYQIFREVQNRQTSKTQLYEIGPRFILNPVCILDGVMKGDVIYRNKMIKVLDKKHRPSDRKYRPKTPMKSKFADFSEEEFSNQQEK